MINRLLTLLFRRRKPDYRKEGEEALMNFALDLAQEWGEDWMKPVHERLRKAYPELSKEQLDKYNTLALETMHDGHNLVYTMAKADGNEFSESAWQASIVSRHPWVDRKNLSHLLSTGKYYAMKDGLL